MKRYFLLICMALAILSLAAQPKVQREWDFGAVGGANLSKYSFYPTVTQAQAPGVVAGVAVRYIEEKYFGLEAELLMAKKGMKDRFDDEYSKYAFQRDFLYVEMPVNAHIYFNLGQKSEVAVDLGPKIGYYLSDKVKTSVLDDSFEEYKEKTRHKFAHHTEAVANKVDYGIQAGLGYEFKFSRELSFQLQGRYYFGLSNMFPDAKGNNFEESSNKSIQVVGTLWFHHRIKIKKQK